MEKNRQTKVIAIVALVVAIVGMSLGFAAFSNILTISSSATVTPNKEDFKLVAYGLGETIDGSVWVEKIGDLSLYTSSTSAAPIYGGGWNDEDPPVDSEIAQISRSGDRISITNLSVTFSEPGQNIFYPILIKNEGEYVAHITDYGMVGNKVCTPGAGTTVELMNSACEQITLGFDNVFNSDGSAATDPFIEPGDYIIIVIDIFYGRDDVARADGPFDVVFPNIEISFSSVAAS